MPFAPVMALELSTPAPKAPPAIVSTVTQQSGEANIKQVDVVFPVGFVYNERFRPPRCQPREEEAEACPEASKVGTVSGENPIASAAGNVYVTDDLRLVAFVQAAGGAIKFKVVGRTGLAPSGAFTVSFSGTPDLPLSKFVLDLAGDDLSLVKNPAACGDYRFDVTFTSYDGDVAKANPVVPITGCAVPLAVSQVRATRTRRGVSLAWAVTEGTEATRVILRRKGKRVRARTIAGTRTRFKGLKPGRYVARLRGRAGDRRSPTAQLSFKVTR